MDQDVRLLITVGMDQGVRLPFDHTYTQNLSIPSRSALRRPLCIQAIRFNYSRSRCSLPHSMLAVNVEAICPRSLIQLYKGIRQCSPPYLDEHNADFRHLQQDQGFLWRLSLLYSICWAMLVLTEVKASVIQCCRLGPASYLVTAADLYSVTAGNHIFKYADDTCLLVPAVNTSSQLDEITHTEQWAMDTTSRDLTVLSRRSSDLSGDDGFKSVSFAVHDKNMKIGPPLSRLSLI